MSLMRVALGTTMTMGWILFDDLVLSAVFISISVSLMSLPLPCPLNAVVFFSSS